MYVSWMKWTSLILQITKLCNLYCLYHFLLCDTDLHINYNFVHLVKSIYFNKFQIKELFCPSIMIFFLSQSLSGYCFVELILCSFYFALFCFLLWLVKQNPFFWLHFLAAVIWCCQCIWKWFRKHSC